MNSDEPGEKGREEVIIPGGKKRVVQAFCLHTRAYQKGVKERTKYVLVWVRVFPNQDRKRQECSF